MGTKLKMLWIGMALVFALVLTLGLSAFVFALPNESFNLSGELSYQILKLDGQDATDDTVVSLGYYTAEVSCEYNGQSYTLTVDFVTTN